MKIDLVHLHSVPVQRLVHPRDHLPTQGVLQEKRGDEKKEEQTCCDCSNQNEDFSRPADLFHNGSPFEFSFPMTSIIYPAAIKDFPGDMWLRVDASAHPHKKAC
jgi:hypothetical protein